MNRGRQVSNYWFMRMKQGSKGENSAKELWSQRLVGVLFGTWTTEDVLGDDSKPERAKFNVEAIEARTPQPPGLHSGRGFSKKFLNGAKSFLFDMAEGDRVVVVYDQAIHIGTLTDEFKDDLVPRGEFKETYKCRVVKDIKPPFFLSDLPTSYRLISSTGRRTVQKFNKNRELIRLLDESDSAEEVKTRRSSMNTTDFLATLSADQWEVVCNEYLRATVGLRSVLLDIGRTLPMLDIIGVDRDGRRVIAQCKNDPEPWTGSRIDNWVEELRPNSEEVVYFFNRGGVEDIAKCHTVDGQRIAEWLEEDPDYLRSLKVM